MLTKKSLTFLAAMGLTLLPYASSNAALIRYDFNDTIAFAANLGAGSPVTTNDFSGLGVTASNWTAVSPVRTIGIQGGQVRALKSADTDTHSFTITIPALVNQTISLSSLTFDHGEVGADTGAPTLLFSSNLGGGSSISPNSVNSTGATNSNTVLATVLTLNGYTGLNNTTIIFTMTDAAQGNNLNTTMYTWYDNFVLTGEIIAIPEPTSIMLLGISIVGFCFYRKR